MHEWTNFCCDSPMMNLEVFEIFCRVRKMPNIKNNCSKVVNQSSNKLLITTIITFWNEIRKLSTISTSAKCQPSSNHTKAPKVPSDNCYYYSTSTITTINFHFFSSFVIKLTDNCPSNKFPNRNNGLTFYGQHEQRRLKSLTWQ